MNHSLQSPYLHFMLNAEKGTWSLNGANPDSPSIEEAWMRVNYRMGLSAVFRTGKRKFSFIEKWYKPRISHAKIEDPNHGQRQQITVEMGPDVNGITYKLEYALLDDHPLFIWRLTLQNTGKHPIEVDRLEMLRAGFFPKRRLLPSPGPISGAYQVKPVGYGAIRPHPEPGELGFFSNGWQSWSYTGAYGPTDRYRDTNLGFFAKTMWYDPGTPRPKNPGHFSSDMFGILGDRKHRTGILAGFLSQKQHFGSLEANIADPLYPAISLWANGDRARLQPGTQIATDWAAIQFLDIDDSGSIDPYLETVARENFIPSKSPLEMKGAREKTGWCSWYHFFQEIDEEKMRVNLSSAQELKESLPIELFQIDDGFEAQIGDWFDFAPGFPNGVAPLADEIKEAGFTPGLWLAPFIVHSKSNLARSKRNWLLKNKWGLPVNAGFVWNNFNKALDLTIPEALDYACEVVRTASQEWGYPYLKLDFLYAAALKGRYRDRTKTRAQVLRKGLEAIREAVGPEVTLLGCGCPLGPAIGLVDAMRIGADAAPHWEPQFITPQAFIRPEPNMPAARNALQNTLTRANLHNRWWINDPDCLLIRSDSELILAEVQSLAAAIAVTGGALLLSDDLPKVSPERLRIANQLVPLIGKTPRVLDWFDSPTPKLVRLDLENDTGKWHLLVVFNWESSERNETFSLASFGIRENDYLAREFWTGELNRISDGVLRLKNTPPHGVKLVSLRPLIQDQPLYVGSDLHISQGLEVTQWFVTPENGVRFSISRPGEAQGDLVLYLPRNPRKILSNAEEIQWQPVGENLYRIPIHFRQSAEIDIQ